MVPISAPGKLLVVWLLTSKESASSLKCSQSDCGVLIWAVPRPSSGWFVRAKGVCQHYAIKGYKV